MGLLILGSWAGNEYHEIEIARHWTEFIVVLHNGRSLRADTSVRVMADHGMLAQIGLDRPWYEPLLSGNSHKIRQEIPDVASLTALMGQASVVRAV